MSNAKPLLFEIGMMMVLLLWLGELAVPSSCSMNLSGIYQLGDSLSDTGNLILLENEIAGGDYFPCAHLPYGVSFFGHPTGRCSNGLLIIDFIAKDVGLPLLKPYLNKDAIFSNGVNFAVAGATALGAESLAAKNIKEPLTNTSLGVQLDWMWSYFNSICYDSNDCVEKLRSALFIVGEVGSNDYYYALSQGMTMEGVMRMVSDVVQAILDGAKRVIEMGASKVIIPGMFPLGCFPAYVSAAFQPNYTVVSNDQHKCSKDLNKLSISHNEKLRWGVQRLTQQHQNITIRYADYYNAFTWLLLNAHRFGLDGNGSRFDVKRACCGVGRWCNFNPRKMCGHRGVPVCRNPDSYVIWDGLHLTHKASRFLARWLITTTISHL